jgi:hypothetical protein
VTPQFLCGHAANQAVEISARGVPAADGGVWIIAESGFGPEGFAPLYLHNGDILSVAGIHP